MAGGLRIASHTLGGLELNGRPALPEELGLGVGVGVGVGVGAGVGVEVGSNPNPNPNPNQELLRRLQPTTGG